AEKAPGRMAGALADIDHLDVHVVRLVILEGHPGIELAVEGKKRQHHLRGRVVDAAGHGLSATAQEGGQDQGNERSTRHAVSFRRGGAQKSSLLLPSSTPIGLDIPAALSQRSPQNPGTWALGNGACACASSSKETSIHHLCPCRCSPAWPV